MKALTIRQPWASLIALGEKQFETRSWKTQYRGQLLIHAGKSIEKNICKLEPFNSILTKYGYTADNLPTGVIIAKCNLVDCKFIIGKSPTETIGALIEDYNKRSTVVGNEYEFGDFTPGRYAWKLEDVQVLNKPIAAKGQLSLWNYNFEEE